MDFSHALFLSVDAGEEEVGGQCAACCQGCDVDEVLSCHALHSHHHVVIVGVEAAAEVFAGQNPCGGLGVVQFVERHVQVESLRNLDNPVVENPVAFHVHVLVGRLVGALGGVEVKSEVEARLLHSVLFPCHIFHNIAGLVLVALRVVVGELLHARDILAFGVLHRLDGAVGGINLAHQGQADDGVLFLRVEVVIHLGGLVAAVEVVDMDVVARCVVPYQQVVHLVAGRACGLVEGVVVLCLAFVHLLHEEVCPRHEHGVVGSVVLLAELFHHGLALGLGDVGRHHVGALPCVAVLVGIATCVLLRTCGGGLVVEVDGSANHGPQGHLAVADHEALGAFNHVELKPLGAAHVFECAHLHEGAILFGIDGHVLRRRGDDGDGGAFGEVPVLCPVV